MPHPAPCRTLPSQRTPLGRGFRRIRSALNTGHLFQQQNTTLSSGVLPLNAGSVPTGTAPTTSLQPLALHGRMPRLQAIFNGTGYATSTSQAFTPSGRHAAFITELGPLSEPLTPAEARQFLSRRPRLLQSHNDQILQWQTCFPQGSSSTGWAGRLADQVSSIVVHPFSLVSLDGVVPALLGSRARHFTDAAGNARVSSFLGQSTARRTALKSLLTEQLNTGAQTQVLTHAYTRTLLDGITHNEDWATTLSGTTAPADALNVGNTHGLTAKLRRVAHIVKAGQAFAAASGSFPRRQVFFVTLGGWDHHNGAAKDHFTYLDILDQALAQFYAQMQALGALDAVTLFTASDFGRALVPNGDGTDHAWAGNHIVMGGAVNGGKIYGQYPDMLLAQRTPAGQLITTSPGQDLTGNGTFVPSLSVDQYMQRLGQWFSKSGKKHKVSYCCLLVHRYLRHGTRPHRT